MDVVGASSPLFSPSHFYAMPLTFRTPEQQSGCGIRQTRARRNITLKIPPTQNTPGKLPFDALSTSDIVDSLARFRDHGGREGGGRSEGGIQKEGERGSWGGGNRRGGPPLEGNLARRKQANLEQGQSKDRGGEFAQALGTTDLIICSQDQTVL